MNKRNSALAAGTGLLLAGTFPIVNLHFLAWIALVPLFFALRAQTPQKGFWLGGISGLVYFAGTVYWVTNSIHFYGNIPLVPASLITLSLCAYLALYPALFGAAVAHINSRRPGMLLVAAPAVWTALELARTYVFSGFPWALLGYSQYSFLSIIQISDITGVYGISFLIVFVNTAIALFLTDRRRIAALASAVVAFLLVLGYGFMRMHAPGGSDTIRIAVIQGNIEQDKKWDLSYQNQTVGVYKRLTLQALKEKPDLIIWPETSTPFYFTGVEPNDRKMTEDLRAFVRNNNLELLFGSPTYEIKGPGAYVLRNSAFLLGPNGDTLAKYDKFHLVPFGEYVPLKSVLFFVEKMVQAIGDFAAGSDYTVMTLQKRGSAPKNVRISTVICYEIIFPDLVRKFVDRGADVITTITNDAWFGRTAAPYQHFSMAVFRAVENHVPVARAANTGISGFIDANGRILAKSGIFTEAELTHTIHTAAASKTFYTRFGDVFSYACVLFSFAVLFLVPKKSF